MDDPFARFAARLSNLGVNARVRSALPARPGVQMTTVRAVESPTLVFGTGRTAEVHRNSDSRGDGQPRENAEPVDERYLAGHHPRAVEAGPGDQPAPRKGPSKRRPRVQSTGEIAELTDRSFSTVRNFLQRAGELSRGAGASRSQPR